MMLTNKRIRLFCCYRTLLPFLTIVTSLGVSNALSASDSDSSHAGGGNNGGDNHGSEEQTPDVVDQKVIPPVLMYHEVRNLEAESARGEKPRPLETSDVTAEAFDQQMTYLAQHFNAVSAQQVYDYMISNQPLPPNPVLITLDDGYLGNYQNAFPILERLQLKATFFVHTTYVGTMRGNPTTPTSFDHMSWDQLRSIAKSPHYEIYSHTMTHPRLTSLQDDAIEKELRVSREEIEKNMGNVAPFLAYPFGAHDKRVVDLTKKYYQMAFIVSRATQKIDGIYQVPRLIVGKESLASKVFQCRLSYWMQNREPNACNQLALEK